ncbi:hypothetical protein AAMO2058_000821200 [Amorphochlora amoebiformis]
MRLRGSNPYGRGQQAAWVSRGLRSGDVYEDQDVLLGEEDGSGRPICEVWDRRSGGVVLGWMIFIFMGCALTNYNSMFGPFPSLPSPTQVQNQPGTYGLKPQQIDNTLQDQMKAYYDSDIRRVENRAKKYASRTTEGQVTSETKRKRKKLRPTNPEELQIQLEELRSLRNLKSQGIPENPRQPRSRRNPQDQRISGNPRDSSPPGVGEADVPKMEAVKRAFVHAWGGYERNAFGHDEVRPTTNETNDSWGGFGVTLFDSLDTMLIMGLDEEYNRALRHVEKTSFDKDYDCSFFETAIRYLGGMLGAYALRPNPILLEKSRDLGDRLVRGFKDTRLGLPRSVLNLRTGESHNHHWNGGYSILSEVGSIQLEFAYLSKITNDPKYYNTARRIFALYSTKLSPLDGLFPVNIDPETGDWGSRGTHITMGGLADSFYEYLLKLYILTGMEDHSVLGMYNKAVASMTKYLVKETGDGETAFLAEYKGGGYVSEMEHLSCFVPGMLALGSSVFDPILNRNHHRDIPLQAPEKELKLESRNHVELADKLLNGCMESYEMMPTGLGPEKFKFFINHPASSRIKVLESRYILRPETVESIFVMYRVTRDPKYREMGWAIFQAIETHCKVDCCYSGLRDVQSVDGELNNSMQSFFLAETLKYLYLLFSPHEEMAIDKFVWTTEAHPLPIFKFGPLDSEGSLRINS